MLQQLARDEQATDEFLHRIGAMRIHTLGSLHEALPDGAEAATSLEDLTWLFSSNYANRSYTMLMFNEAAWLMKTVRAMTSPRVAELGRGRGGTTILLAAAGADVVTVDSDKLEISEARRSGPADVSYGDSLTKTLDRLELGDQVEMVSADALDYVPEGSYDMVFVDLPFGLEEEERVFELWWPALRRGGWYILRDGREERMPGNVEMASRLDRRSDLTLHDGAVGKMVAATKS